MWLSAGIFAKAEEEEQAEGLVEGSVDASITSDDQEQKKSAAHIDSSTAEQSEASAKQVKLVIYFWILSYERRFCRI